MKTYYEVATRDGSNTFPEIDAFDTIEEAIEFAEANGADLICEVGATFDDYAKCWFCGEWVPVCELDREDTCSRCQLALWSRGEY